MLALKAHVENGRVIVDDPVDLPDGCELEVFVEDPLGDMDPEERAALERAIELGIAQADAGLTVDADVVLADLRRS